MKRYKYTLILLGFLTSISLGSCKKYLEQVPDNRTEINSVEKVAQLLGTAYPTYDYLAFTEAASDNSEDKGVGIGNLNDLIDRP